jgi:hypothetical protein
MNTASKLRQTAAKHSALPLMASSVNYQLKLCPSPQHGKTHPAESSAGAEIAPSRVASGFAPSYVRNGIFSATRKRKFGTHTSRLVGTSEEATMNIVNPSVNHSIGNFHFSWHLSMIGVVASRTVRELLPSVPASSRWRDQYGGLSVHLISHKIKW